jgi:murein DD-endopeptidase MepM/ murein hydrolase activator NlpD
MSRASKPVVLKPAPEPPGVPAPEAGDFGWPLKDPSEHIVQAPFGVRSPAGLTTGEWHEGIDIQAPPGTRVVAARAGRVAWTGERPALGWTLILEHDERWHTVYGNLEAPALHVGDRVERGSDLGVTSAACDGEGGGCLHFEVRWQGRAVDPAPLLPRR